MNRPNLLQTAHDLIRAHLQPGDDAIDATLGNGHDCLFLARLVGDNGHVYGFDIQADAITASRKRLASADINKQVTLFHCSHTQMRDVIPNDKHGKIKAILFNLGYLPGGDKSLITQTESTLAALNSAITLLAANGILTIMAYPGHSGGDSETLAVCHWCSQLQPGQFQIDHHNSAHHQTNSPQLFVIRKL